MLWCCDAWYMNMKGHIQGMLMMWCCDAVMLWCDVVLLCSCDVVMLCYCVVVLLWCCDVVMLWRMCSRIGEQFNSMATWDQNGGDGSLFIGCNDEFCCQVWFKSPPTPLYFSSLSIRFLMLFNQDCWSIGILNLDLPVKLIQSSPSSNSCPYRWKSLFQFYLRHKISF